MTQRPAREEEIRHIAYGIWEQEGRPQGKDLEHFLLAEKMWEDRQKALSSSASLPRPAPGVKATSRMRRVGR